MTSSTMHLALSRDRNQAAAPSRPRVLLSLAALASGPLAAVGGAQGSLSIASVSGAGVQGNGKSSLEDGGSGVGYGAVGRQVSGDGNATAFATAATNLGGPNSLVWDDIYVRDVAMATTTQVNLTVLGAQPAGQSYNPAISSDGTVVGFGSNAPDFLLPAGPPLFNDNVLAFDLTTGALTLESVGFAGAESNGHSHAPSLSGDGSLIAFWSTATDLTPAVDANGPVPDVFVRTRAAGLTVFGSVDGAGVQFDSDSDQPALAAGGSALAFRSRATNLLGPNDPQMDHVYLRDLAALTTSMVDVTPGGQAGGGPSREPSISADGRFVAFTSSASDLVLGDTNGVTDVFLRDRSTATTRRVSSYLDQQGVEVQAHGPSSRPSVSDDGRYVSFTSAATDLVPHAGSSGADVYLRDMQSGEVQLLSLGSSGFGGGAPSGPSAISGDGQVIVFDSDAQNLLPGPLIDGNGVADVFRLDRTALLAFPLCFGPAMICPCNNQGTGSEGCANSTGGGSTMSASGTSSISADDLVLSATGLVYPGGLALFFQAANSINGGTGTAFGDGLRCCGGSVLRLEDNLAPDPTGTVSTSIGIAARNAAAATHPALSPGDTLCYQCWYRDPDLINGPCGFGFNLSNGLSITWTP